MTAPYSPPADRLEQPEPETMPIAEAARRLGISENKVYQAIRDESAALIPDALRMVPGGRVNGEKYIVQLATFNRVMSGEAAMPAPLPVASLQFLHRVGRAS